MHVDVGTGRPVGQRATVGGNKLIRADVHGNVVNGDHAYAAQLLVSVGGHRFGCGSRRCLPEGAGLRPTLRPFAACLVLALEVDDVAERLAVEETSNIAEEEVERAWNV